MRSLLGLVITLPLTACTGSSNQVLTGHVAPGFTSPITTVKIMRGGSVLATSPIAADGWRHRSGHRQLNGMTMYLANVLVATA